MKNWMKKPPAMASVMLAFVSLLTIMSSDLLLRARGLDKVNGIDAHSYDVVGTIMLLVALWGFVVSIRAAHRESDPITTKRVRLSHSGGQAQEASELALDDLKVMCAAQLGGVYTRIQTNAPGDVTVFITGPASKVNSILEAFVKAMCRNHQYLPMEVLP